MNRHSESHDRFVDYFTKEHEPPYPAERAERLAEAIARHALLCVESAEWLQRRVDQLDELTRAEIDSDRVFIKQPTLFEYNLADREGEALPPRLEITDTAQADFDRNWDRWE